MDALANGKAVLVEWISKLPEADRAAVQAVVDKAEAQAAVQYLGESALRQPDYSRLMNERKRRPVSKTPTTRNCKRGRRPTRRSASCGPTRPRIRISPQEGRHPWIPTSQIPHGHRFSRPPRSTPPRSMRVW